MSSRDVTPQLPSSGLLPAVEGAAAGLVAVSALLCWVYVLGAGGPYGGSVLFALLLSPVTLVLLLTTGVLRLLGRRSRPTGRALAVSAAALGAAVLALVAVASAS
jgi:hypothetical protein